MARKHFLINRHTPNQTGFPSDLKLGEIAVRHNEEAPELIINLLEDGDESDFRTFIDKVAIINMLSATTLDLQGKIDDVSENLEANYATSADTHAAIKSVDAKFASYATSADTHAAIGAVDAKFASYATSAATVAAIAKVQGEVDVVEKNLADNYATSADTHAAIVAVDGKFANYATSAATVAAIDAVDGKFANYATSAATVAAIAKVQGEVDAVESNLDKAISSLTETINTKVSSAYIYQGSKATFEELPNDNSVKVGHVWNVEAAHENHPAGTNYAWTGTEWDALAGMVDLTIYATSANTHEAIAKVQGEVDAVEKNLADNYATSADTHAAIGAVDAKFASYATSAATVAAIGAVDAKFASYATSAATVAAIAKVQGEVDAVESNLETNYATSANTHAAIGAVDAKFASYATSAATVAAIDAVDGKFAAYATSAATVAAIAKVQGEVDAVELRVEDLESLSAATQSAIQTIEVSGVTGVKVIKSGTTRTIDFSEMYIDCGEF